MLLPLRISVQKLRHGPLFSGTKQAVSYRRLGPARGCWYRD